MRSSLKPWKDHLGKGLLVFSYKSRPDNFLTPKVSVSKVIRQASLCKNQPFTKGWFFPALFQKHLFLLLRQVLFTRVAQYRKVLLSALFTGAYRVGYEVGATVGTSLVGALLGRGVIGLLVG
mmetsp:Transcript_32271/g.51475  ORF Transcript_32271/g.51475 Transcript_32271/m.51475 type:complete len:122 (-) Transcript_32271:690-1055(-)